jgi:hypothetical protein
VRARCQTETCLGRVRIAATLGKKNLSCRKCHTLDEEAHLSDVMLLTAILGVVSATARILYQHPIQWAEETDDELGSSARTKMQNLF